MTIHNQFSFAIYSVLFFGFFVYTFAVLKGFPNFLGGMFSLSIILFFPFVFLKYLISLKKESHAIEWIYLLLICYVFIYSLFAALFFNNFIFFSSFLLFGSNEGKFVIARISFEFRSIIMPDADSA